MGHIGVMDGDLPPQLTAVRVGPGHVLHLTFADGASGSFDVGPYLWGPAFEQVHSDPAVFAAARVDPELGTVVWPGDVDLAPEFLYDHAVRGQVAHTGHDPRDEPEDCASAALTELAWAKLGQAERQQTLEHGEAAVAELARQVREARQWARAAWQALFDPALTNPDDPPGWLTAGTPQDE